MSVINNFQLPDYNDFSVQVLHEIFGMPIDNIYNKTGPLQNTLITDFLGHFDTALLGAFAIIFAIILVIGTLNTAHEGKFLGKDWSSVWVPIRATITPALMFPISKGFCALQYFLMYGILVGVNMATYVWQQSIQDIGVDPVVAPPVAMQSQVAQNVSALYLYAAADHLLGLAYGNPNQSGFSMRNQSSQGQSELPVNSSLLSGQGLPAIQQAVIKMCTSADNSGNYYYPDPDDCAKQLLQQLTNSNGNPQSSYTVTSAYSSNYGSNIQYVLTLGSNSNESAPQFTVQGATNNSYDLGVSTNPAPTGASFTYNGTTYDLSNVGIEKAILGDSSNLGGYVGNGTPNNCTSPYNCSLLPLASAVVVGAQSSAAKAAASSNSGSTGLSSLPIPGTGSNCDYSCRDLNTNAPLNDQMVYTSMTGAPSCMVNSANGNQIEDSNAYITQQCFTRVPNQNNPNTYTYQPVSNSDTNLTYNNSWWYAGEVYLGLAHNMSGSSSSQSRAVQAINAAQVNNGGSLGAEFTASLPISLTAYLGTPGGNWTPYTNTSVSNSSASGATVTISVNGTSPGQSVGSWQDVVDYIFFNYDSVLDPNNNNLAYFQNALQTMKSQSPTDYESYTAMLQLPQQYRAPFYMLAAVSSQLVQPVNFGDANSGSCNIPWWNIKHWSEPSDCSPRGGPGVLNPGYYNNGGYNVGQLQQYAVSMLSVLVQNGVVPNPWSPALDNSQVQGAVQQIMDQIFGGLLNGQLGLSFAGEYSVDNQGSQVSANISGLMNQIYNLGNVTANIDQIPQQNMDMIAETQNIGISMINTVVSSVETISQQYESAAHGDMAAIATTGGAFTAAGLLAAAAPFVSAGPAIVAAGQLAVQIETLSAITDMSMHLVWLPLAIMVMSALFTTGVIFSLLIPITPYILFWAGEMAWILGVIEAMIAAPMILLGMAHPGGHNILGHAVPAVKMYLGILFRPVLMVLGLLVGIVLTFILISLSAQGFHAVADSVLGLAGAGGVQQSMNTGMGDSTFTQGILASIMVMVYASFLGLAFNKCFSAIYVFPEKVVQWIGGQADKAGQEELQQMSQSTQQTADKAAQAGGSGLQAKTEAEKQEVQGTSQAASTGISGAGSVTDAVNKDRDNAKQKGSSGGSGGGGAGGGDAGGAPPVAP